DVFDDRASAAVGEFDASAEHLGQYSHFAWSRLEATHVDESGGENLAGSDRGDASDRHEHLPPTGDLDHQSDHARRHGTSVDDDDVTDLAEPVADGVEDGAAGQARYENPLCAHASSVVRDG